MAGETDHRDQALLEGVPGEDHLGQEGQQGQDTPPPLHRPAFSLQKEKVDNPGPDAIGLIFVVILNLVRKRGLEYKLCGTVETM